MNAHKNARMTPFGRAVMIRRVLQEGWSVSAVAASFEVSTRTVRKWLARFRREGRAGLENRSSTPHLVANKVPAPWLAMIARLRREYRMTSEEIALRLRLPRSTVASHLWRLGLGRLAALEPSEPARPRFHTHYTPTYASWLNQVERWFAILTSREIRRGSFASARDLVTRISAFVAAYNAGSRPFAWTATADNILAKLGRLCNVISGTLHWAGR